jgi:hypothetical protein
MRPAPTDPYIPLVGALIFLVLGLFPPTPWSCMVSLAFAALGISKASSKLQRFLGIIIFAFSAAALFVGALAAGWLSKG